MNRLSTLATNKSAWLLLALSALALELAALYFQYVLGLAPCIMCIYQRVAIWAIFVAGLIGYFSATHLIGRMISFILWAIGSIWGLLIANEHVNIQNDPFGFLNGCESVPNFPSWAPLHEWIPPLFEASGSCGDIDWQFLNYSMPQWMIVVYAIYTFLFTIVFLTRVFNLKNI